MVGSTREDIQRTKTIHQKDASKLVRASGLKNIDGYISDVVEGERARQERQNPVTLTIQTKYEQTISGIWISGVETIFDSDAETGKRTKLKASVVCGWLKAINDAYLDGIRFDDWEFRMYMIFLQRKRNGAAAKIKGKRVYINA